MTAVKLYDLARMTTATSGTGTITLGSAVAGFLSFADAGVSDGESVYYAISDGSASETGVGVYTSSGTTLSRSVIKSTNSDSAISLSGSAQVMITPLSSQLLALKIADSDDSHELTITTGSNLTADRDFTINPGDAARTLTIGGDVTIDDDPITVGKHTVWIPAAAMTARDTNGAASGSTELATNDVMLSTFDFDTTTEEGVGFHIAMPTSWNEGTVTFQPYWTAASGSGTAIFELAGVATSNDDALDAAPGTAQSSTDTFIAANDCHIGPESSAITIAGSPAAGDLVYFQITRDVATDTLGVDASLIGIKLFLTYDAAVDS